MAVVSFFIQWIAFKGKNNDLQKGLNHQIKGLPASCLINCSNSNSGINLYKCFCQSPSDVNDIPLWFVALVNIAFGFWNGKISYKYTFQHPIAVYETEYHIAKTCCLISYHKFPKSIISKQGFAVLLEGVPLQIR